MSAAVLHVISDRTRHEEIQTLQSALAKALLAGADMVQIREKKAPAAEVFALCQMLRDVPTPSGQPPQILVNDRIDIAMAANLRGVHLARLSLPVEVTAQLRQRSGWRGIIGVSVHSLEEAQNAQAAGADYVTFGHVYASESHRGEAPRGVRALANVVEALNIPVIAVGGIDRLNVDTVLDTGCAGVAVIGAIVGQTNPEAATYALKNRMEAVNTQPKIQFPASLAE